MRAWAQVAWGWFRGNLWPVPFLALVATFGLSELTAVADDHLDFHVAQVILADLSPGSAEQMLSTISSSMITFTGLVFSVTMLVLQLSSRQLSPRVMRTFLRDSVTQIVLAIFVSTFLYSILVLRKIPANAGQDLPPVSLTVVLVLVVLSLMAFTFYVNHIAQSIRPSNVIRLLGNETRASISHAYPEKGDEEQAQWQPGPFVLFRDIRMADSSVLIAASHATLAGIAAANSVVLELRSEVGSFLSAGMAVVRAWGAKDDIDRLHEGQVLDALRFGHQRVMDQDPAFGFRQLVDIAERALSPGVNDPTTAVAVLDELHRLLVFLNMREVRPARVLADDEGHPRLVIRYPSWDDLVRLSLDEIRHFGASALSVLRRQRYLILTLADVAAPERRIVLRAELGLLDRVVDQRFPAEGDHRLAATADNQG